MTLVRFPRLVCRHANTSKHIVHIEAAKGGPGAQDDGREEDVPGDFADDRVVREGAEDAGDGN